MRKKRLITGLGLFSVCSLLFTVSTSLMWFDNKTKVIPNQIVGSSDGAYYASGDGSKDNPYVINQPRHLYNLAWLQYLGTYNKDSNNDGSIDEVYFRVDGNTINSGGDSVLDMDGWVLPPIGTEDNPFVGNFDGNNTIIKNLTISNTFSDYGTAHPYYGSDGNELTESTFSSPQIIGFFGVIGALNESDSKKYEYSSKVTNSDDTTSSDTLVYDTYIDDVTIKNKESKATKKEVLAGLIAGYVNAPIIRCGVGYGEFSFADGTEKLSTAPTGATINGVSNYSLIGAYNPNKFSYSGLPTDSSGGSGDQDYGTSINVYELYNKLSSSLGSTSNPLTIPSNYAIPIKFDSSKSVVSGSGTTSVQSSGTSITVNNGSTIPVDSNTTNIGYYSGSFGIYKDTYSSKDFSSITTATNSPVSYSSLTKTEKEKIQNYLSKATTTGKNSDNAIELDGSSNFNGANQTRAKAFPTSPSAYTVIKNAKIGNTTKDALIPTNGIWVAPTKPGRFEFIASGTKIQTVVLIVRLQRSTAKDYSTGFTNTSYLIQFNNDWSTGMVGFAISGTNTVYYGLEITQSDIDAGYEYFITNDADMNGSIFGYPTIFYLDIGTDGGSSGGGSSTTTSPTEIDFVYYDSSTKKLVKITSEKNSDGNYIYKNSNVVFQIGSTASGTVSFNRTTSDAVLYYVGSNTIKVIGTGTSTNKEKQDDVPKNS